MVYTIYNALGKEPSAWRDGKPLATVETVIPPEYEAYTAKFWPWRESELVDLVLSGGEKSPPLLCGINHSSGNIPSCPL